MVSINIEIPKSCKSCPFKGARLCYITVWLGMKYREVPEEGRAEWCPMEEADRWIPCKERLPEDEYVLISKKPTKLSGSKWSVAIAIRTADPRSGKIQWRDIGFGVIQDDKVLAWRPLPEPYEGRRDGNK